MNCPGYERIIQDICSLAGARDWQEVAENGVLCIDGVQMQLQPDCAAGHEESILVHVDFAALPAEHTGDFLRMLLDMNFLAGTPNARTFSTNPQSDQVVAMRRIPLSDGIDGYALLEILRDEAHTARHWRRNWQHNCALGGKNVIPVSVTEKRHAARQQ